MSGASDVKHKKSDNPNDNIYRTIIKNRKIDRMIMPFEAVYCVWLIITLVLNFKLFAYSIDAQFVLISLFFIRIIYFLSLKKITSLAATNGPDDL